MKETVAKVSSEIMTYAPVMECLRALKRRHNCDTITNEVCPENEEEMPSFIRRTINKIKKVKKVKAPVKYIVKDYPASFCSVTVEYKVYNGSLYLSDCFYVPKLGQTDKDRADHKKDEKIENVIKCDGTEWWI